MIYTFEQTVTISYTDFFSYSCAKRLPSKNSFSDFGAKQLLSMNNIKSNSYKTISF